MGLTDKERKITLAVMHRFLNLGESTPHKPLLSECKDPKAIEHLMRVGVLRTFGQPASYLPRVLAFQYSGDADALRQAKSAVTLTIKVLKNLFEVELERETFTLDDVQEHAHKICDFPPTNHEITLGFFLVAEFANVMKSCRFNSTHTEMVSLELEDNIVALTDIDGMWDRHVLHYSRYLQSGTDLLEKIETTTEAANSMVTPPTHRGLLVFISHSNKDAELALALIELLRSALGLLADQIRCSSVDGYRLPVGVNTEEKLREEVNAAAVVIGLVTPNSLPSHYVMFELGARWGAKLFLAPLLAGVKTSELSGPLSLLNALVADKEEQLHQLLKDVSLRLGVPLQNTSSYLRHISPVKTLAQNIPTRINVNVPLAEPSPMSIEFEPSSGKSDKIVLTVTNRGKKQTFRAQCRLVECRNDPDPQRKVTFDLRWQYGGKEKQLVTGEADNLFIASAGEDKPHGLEWMKLEGSSNRQEPDSRWARSEKNRPEFDLDITVLGNQSAQPETERFTLRAGTSCALEMHKRECKIVYPSNGAEVGHKHIVNGTVSPSDAKVQLWVYTGEQYHNNGFAKVEGQKWKKQCRFGNPSASLGGTYLVVAIANGTIRGDKKWKTLPNTGTRSNEITVRRTSN